MLKTRLLYLCSFVTLVVSSILSISFFIPSWRENIFDFTADYPLVLFLVLIITKTLAFAFAPVPVGWISVFCLPYLGWFNVALADLISSLVGNSIGFLISRNFGRKFVYDFLKFDKFELVENKLKKLKTTKDFIIVRLFTFPIVDYVSYIAAFSSLNFRQFFVATLIGDGAMSFVVFFILNEGYKQSVWLMFGIAGVGTLLLSLVYSRFLKKWSR